MISSRRVRKLFGVSVLVIAASGFLPRVACAEDARDPAAAEALFRQGRSAASQRDFKTACDKFRESNRLDPAVGTVFNIADCEEKLGRLATSWTLFQEVVQRLAADDNRRAIAEQRVHALEPRVPKLSIRLAHSDREGVIVRRDGVTLGAASLDTALPLDPGEHVVIVEAPGTKPAEFHAQLAEGQSLTLDVAVGAALPAGAEPQTGAPQSGAPPAKNHTAAYVVGGIGLAGLITGGIAGALVLSHKSTVDSQCVGKECTQKGLDAAHSGKTLGVVSTVGFVVAGLGLGGATFLFLTAPTSAEHAQSAAYAVGLGGKW